ncbi:molybdenum cofactor biosynthesis protein MoaE [Kocuria rhizophila]|uniref:molybdenum cofactor biosynthesis protein MoaE n=1 Tax=Kocuria rhizophila TaxID=72000 RepID=UPI002D1F9FBF|nr:molybdenum cofactor biosynthesis protein MoaE [Kocuria rhizophila]
MSGHGERHVGAERPAHRDEIRDFHLVGRRAEVVIVSSSAARGTAEDLCGPVLRTWLEGRGLRVRVHVVPDGPEVLTVLRELTEDSHTADGPRLVVTSGGTGLNSDDVTPESTARVLERQSPGIMQALWAQGLRKTPTAAMSRGVAGQVGRTFLVNLPGSRGGVKDGMAVLDPLIDHISAQLEDVHGHGEDRSVTRSGDEVLPAEGAASPASSAGFAVSASSVIPTSSVDPVGSAAQGAEPAGAAGPGHDAARVPDAASSPPEPGEAGRGRSGAGAVLRAGITEEPLDGELARREVADPGCGAVVGFSGVIRDHDGGRDGVTGLAYSAHPSAAQVMAEVVAGTAREHPGTRVWAEHRIGALAVGDSALEVAVAAAHRTEAFAACSALVDRIKASVPIWKRESFADGQHTWVGLDA